MTNTKELSKQICEKCNIEFEKSVILPLFPYQGKEYQSLVQLDFGISSNFVKLYELEYFDPRFNFKMSLGGLVNLAESTCSNRLSVIQSIYNFIDEDNVCIKAFKLQEVSENIKQAIKNEIWVYD